MMKTFERCLGITGCRESLSRNKIMWSVTAHDSESGLKQYFSQPACTNVQSSNW